MTVRSSVECLGSFLNMGLLFLLHESRMEMVTATHVYTVYMFIAPCVYKLNGNVRTKNV